MHLPWPALLAAVAVRTATVLVGLVVGVRLIGRRPIGEMSAHDLLVVLLVSNAVQNAMTHGEPRLSVALVSSGTLIGLGLLAAWAFRANPALERALVGRPIVLVCDGRVVRRNLRQGQVTREHIDEAIRKQGVAGLADVTLAVLEVNGQISVVPKDHAGA